MKARTAGKVFGYILACVSVAVILIALPFVCGCYPYIVPCVQIWILEDVNSEVTKGYEI